MNKTKTTFKVPHTLVIIFSIIIIIAILTYIIPGGKYDRVERNGRTVVLSDSFHYVEGKHQGFGALLLAPFRGFIEAAQIIAFVIIVGGAFMVIQKTGAIDGMIKSISAAHARSKILRNRIFCWIVITGTAILFVSRYAAKVKANPEISPTFAIDLKKRASGTIPSENTHTLDRAHLLVLIFFCLALILLVVGVLKYGWYIPEIAALFFGTAIISGLIGKLSPSTIAESFVDGTKDMMGAVLIISLLLFYQTDSYAQGYVLAVGGKAENYHDWSDGPYGWMVEKANFGKIINIDVDEASSWYPGYFKYLGASSSSHALQIPDRATANSDNIYNELKSASGIFIEGGDQWDYVNTWKDTKVQQAIQEVFQAGGVIGGTSAGLAVLGEIVFDAKYGSARPEKAVYDAYIPQIHFEDQFLCLLPGILTDSHFTQRGRLGRLVTMLARWMQDHPDSDILGLGIDEKTAICIDPDLTGRVFGKASVTVLYKTPDSQIYCPVGRAPYFTNIGYDQLIHGCIYDLKKRTLLHPGDNLIETGALPLTPAFSNVTLEGSNEATAENGTYIIENILSERYAVFYGELTQRAGDNIVPNSIIMPKVWNDYDYFQNRLGGSQWGLATHPHFTAILIDDYNCVYIDENGIMSTNYIVHVLDSYGVTYTGLNASGCQIPGIIGAKLHFLTADIQYDLKNHQLAASPVTFKSNTSAPRYFELLQNYPNPFNQSTRIVFNLQSEQWINLTVYDILGRQIRIVTHRFFDKGSHSVNWDGTDNTGKIQPAGIYFIKLHTATLSQTKKIIKFQ